MPDDVIVSDLFKNYGSVAALSGVSFSAAAGSIFGLLGRNGAGKTTAIECIIGLRRPDRGSVVIRGVDSLNFPNEIKELIGVQLQATALQDKITPREALRLFASFYRNRAPVDALIERFSLAEKADAHFDSLSAGQKQRLALALAFVNEPKVVFLDEPTAGLDPQARRDLRDRIRQIRAEGRTVILTTHDVEEAEQLCDRVAIIHHGKIIACDEVRKLIAASASANLEDAFIKLTGERAEVE